ncbi:TIR domain-containing protein [Amycolatopsis sp. RM579]|uniref:TIR domain-containing protein n=1 Tax=Amycolatopsis pithecellobii TaxID=664692 RepID=A0A6N7Z6Q6_9PSEU|nr:TIR domain-containing protein [Amycolatopsis pithecellobii]
MYEYDVFISYHRTGALVPAWVRNHFHPRLAELLDENLPREAKIFFDEEITSGGKWPYEVRSALQRARIVVAVCSPKYFYDEWCLAEWYSMAKREQLVVPGQGLIYPVIFCDSANFPGYAHERRMRDLKNWNQPYAHFQDAPAYLDFHREMERIAIELTGLLDEVPPWQPDWPVETPEPPAPGTSRLPRF